MNLRKDHSKKGNNNNYNSKQNYNCGKIYMLAIPYSTVSIGLHCCYGGDVWECGRVFEIRCCGVIVNRGK